MNFRTKRIFLSRVCGDYIRRVLDGQVDLLDTLTVTINYSVYTLRLTVHHTRAESSHLCLHWLHFLSYAFRATCSAHRNLAALSFSLSDFYLHPLQSAHHHLRSKCSHYDNRSFRFLRVAEFGSQGL
jgi:hypothetical protein